MDHGSIILTADGVTKTFGKLQALNGVDMAVKRGEIFGIAGPNGAGKSTLFNVIAGSLAPTGGTITFDGADITGLKSHRICRRGLARTFQVPRTFPSLTVYDNVRVGVTFGSPSTRGVKKRIDAALAFLDLTGVRHVQASNLDLYTTKMVMMAACLATGCRLLMLDEPLAGLSITEIADFVRVVRHVNADGGITILMIEHILDALIDISERLLILDNGEVIYTGDPEGVRTDPQVVTVYLGDGQVMLEEEG
jgi:ABC-type branched-subunit amino acid transport system ATPase component